MIFKTTSGRVEMEYQRGSVFFVRLPLLGEVLWTHVEGWPVITGRSLGRRRFTKDKGRRLFGTATSGPPTRESLLDATTCGAHSPAHDLEPR